MNATLDIVVLGLALRSSWGNGHATTWRALVRALRRRGHRVLFLERDVPWYAQNQDASEDLTDCVALYGSYAELIERYGGAIARADLVMLGSYVPEGAKIGAWLQRTARGLTAFYDIDTPVTLAQLAQGKCEYLDAQCIAGFDMYLSFTGGPTLQALHKRYGANAHAFYCAVDETRYAPQSTQVDFDLGYMGTYSADRQPGLERLLLRPARHWAGGRFVVAGAQYPALVAWPENCTHIEHVGPDAHREFYNRQRFTLNITRSDMIAAGWSPSVRLFEAAACGTPIISDAWAGLESLFSPGREILIAHDAAGVLHWLRELPQERRVEIGAAARRRVLAEHTAAHRVEALERHIDQATRRRARNLVTRSICHDSTA